MAAAAATSAGPMQCLPPPSSPGVFGARRHPYASSLMVISASSLRSRPDVSVPEEESVSAASQQATCERRSMESAASEPRWSEMILAMSFGGGGK